MRKTEDDVKQTQEERERMGGKACKVGARDP